MMGKDDTHLSGNDPTQKVIDALKKYQMMLDNLRIKYVGELDEQQQNDFFVLSCMLVLNNKYINLLLTLKNGHNSDDNSAVQFIDDKNRDFSESLLSDLKLNEISLEGDSIFDIWSVISKNLAGENDKNITTIKEMSNRNVSIANKDILAAAVIICLGILSAGALTFVASFNITIALIIPIALVTSVLAALPGVYSDMRYKFAHRLSSALSISGEDITLPAKGAYCNDPSKVLNSFDMPMKDMKVMFFDRSNRDSSLEDKFKQELNTMHA